MIQPSEVLQCLQETVQSNTRASLGFAVIAGVALMQWMHSRRKTKAALYQKVKEKLEERRENFLSLLQQVEGEEINEEESRILGLTLDEALQEMKSKKLKCSEVLRAYQKRAYQVTKKLNCVVEFVLEAQEVAKELDSHPDPWSLPLYGLPISVKLCHSLKGHLKSEGYVRDLYNAPAEEDGVTVAALKNLGAIPFVISNIPQTLGSARTKNPIFGETLNPIDPTRTSGGSSGGDGALVGSGAALAALGTDIGGSLRIPAVFCGNASFKQTGNRFSIVRVGDVIKGIVGVQDNAGFQCRDVGSLVTMFKAMYHPLSRDFMQDKDVNLPPLDFNESMFESQHKLCIGYTYGWDDFLPITPVARRAVDMAVDALKAKGHKLVRYDYPDPQKAIDANLGIFAADGYEQLQKRLANDIIDGSIAQLFHVFNTPSFMKKILGWIGKMTNIQCLLPYYAYRGISVEELWDLQFTRFQYVQQVRNSWDKMGLDAVVAPGYACPALKIHDASRAPLLFVYTGFYNFLDFPAGIVPVTRVHQSDISALKEEYTKHSHETKVIYSSAPGSEGLPMAVQIVSLRWKDELVLRIMKEVEEGVRLGR